MHHIPELRKAQPGSFSMNTVPGRDHRNKARFQSLMAEGVACGYSFRAWRELHVASISALESILLIPPKYSQKNNWIR